MIRDSGFQLSTLSVGDRCMIRLASEWLNTGYIRATVTKITDTQIAATAFKIWGIKDQGYTFTKRFMLYNSRDVDLHRSSRADVLMIFDEVEWQKSHDEVEDKLRVATLRYKIDDKFLRGLTPAQSKELWNLVSPWLDKFA